MPDRDSYIAPNGDKISSILTLLIKEHSLTAQVTISQMSRVALSFIYVRTPVGSLTLSLHEAQRDRCSAAPMLDRRFCGRVVSFFEGSICNSICSNLK